MPRPADYEMIRLWSEMLMKHPDDVRAQQELACADNAPINAVYKRDGAWRTADEVTNPTTRKRLGLGSAP